MGPGNIVTSATGNIVTAATGKQCGCDWANRRRCLPRRDDHSECWAVCCQNLRGQAHKSEAAAATGTIAQQPAATANIVQQQQQPTATVLQQQHRPSICNSTATFVVNALVQTWSGQSRFWEHHSRIVPAERLTVLPSVNGFNHSETLDVLLQSGIQYWSLSKGAESWGKLAGYLTNLRALQHQLEQRTPYQFTMEDDVVLRPNFMSYVESACAHYDRLRPQPSLLQLSSYLELRLTSLAGARQIMRGIRRYGIVKNDDQTWLDPSVNHNMHSAARRRRPELTKAGEGKPWELGRHTNRGSIAGTRRLTWAEVAMVRLLTSAKNGSARHPNPWTLPLFGNPPGSDVQTLAGCCGQPRSNSVWTTSSSKNSSRESVLGSNKNDSIAGGDAQPVVAAAQDVACNVSEIPGNLLARVRHLANSSAHDLQPLPQHAAAAALGKLPHSVDSLRKIQNQLSCLPSRMAGHGMKVLMLVMVQERPDVVSDLRSMMAAVEEADFSIFHYDSRSVDDETYLTFSRRKWFSARAVHRDIRGAGNGCILDSLKGTIAWMLTGAGKGRYTHLWKLDSDLGFELFSFRAFRALVEYHAPLVCQPAILLLR